MNSLSRPDSMFAAQGAAGLDADTEHFVGRLENALLLAFPGFDQTGVSGAYSRLRVNRLARGMPARSAISYSRTTTSLKRLRGTTTSWR